MRVTQSMYYNNIFGTNNSKLNKDLFDVNKQIASGLKIQYASDNVRTFTETMRLDNEITTIAQTKKSVQSGYKTSDQTDVSLNEFTDSMNRMRTLLVQAANDTNDNTSRDAIAKELRGIEKNLRNLANTSINGQYIFSGSAVNVKPIAEDGTYKGNDVAMKAFLGSNSQQKYNIAGSELFLGEESNVQKQVTTNVVNASLLPSGGELTPSSSIAELMGDKDTVKLNQSHFYLRGTKSDGTSFKKIINLNDNATIQDLLSGIENSYAANTVNVSMNNNGQIIVEDKQNGSSKLDFHLVGAVDYNSNYTSGSAVPADRAKITNIDALDGAKTDYATSSATDYFVKEFSRSNLSSVTNTVTGNPTNIQGLIYDRAEFEKNGSKLTSNAPQIIQKKHYVSDKGYVVDSIKKGEPNGFATGSTLLSEVANTKNEILPSTTPHKTYTIAPSTLNFDGKKINGTAFSATFNLPALPATASFSIGGSTYDIFNVDGTKVESDKITYRQMMDVMNIITTDTLPTTTNSANDYHTATDTATFKGTTSLSYDGRLEFNDLTNANTKADIALYDANSKDFSKNASIMTFNTNNALTIRDPKTDFFKTINDIIQGVESYSNAPDANDPVVRSVGIQNAIAMMDDLQDHIFRTQATAGAQSNTLSKSLERVQTLEISTMSLRSSVIDTDLAESSLKLSQLTLNYKAMLSTVSKVSQLSLVNYL